MTVGITPDPSLVGPTGPTGSAGAAGATGPTGAAGGTSIAVFQNQQTAGTSAANLTGGSFVTLTINTEQYNNISGASLSSNQITLPAGTYWYSGTGQIYGKADAIHTKLRNITDSTDTLQGFSQYRVTTNAPAGLTYIEGVFTIAAQKTFEAQIRVESTVTNGQGFRANFGVTEVYSSYTFMKIG